MTNWPESRQSNRAAQLAKPKRMYFDRQQFPLLFLSTLSPGVLCSHNSQENYLVYHLSHTPLRDYDAAKEGQTVFELQAKLPTNTSQRSPLSCPVEWGLPDNEGLSVIMWTFQHNSVIASLSVSSSLLARSPWFNRSTQSFLDLNDTLGCISLQSPRHKLK